MITSKSPEQRVRQRFVEILAVEDGASPGLVAGWRTYGSVPHKRRQRLVELGREVGVELRIPDDFINWTRHYVK